MKLESLRYKLVPQMILIHTGLRITHLIDFKFNCLLYIYKYLHTNLNTSL